MKIKHPIKSLSAIFGILRKNGYIKKGLYVDDSTMEECYNALENKKDCSKSTHPAGIHCYHIRNNVVKCMFCGKRSPS